MALKLSKDALVSVARARAYLQDNGVPAEGQDMLTLHVNAASAFILGYCGRRRLAWVDEDLTEYRRGDGGQTIWTREAPIKKLTSVTLFPHISGLSTVITGPTSPALSTDECYFDEREGFIRLANLSFPESDASIKLVYRAGYYTDDQPTAGDQAEPERSLLELTTCELVLRKWKRWKSKSIGTLSESNERGSISYDESELDPGTAKSLEQFKRNRVT